MKGGSEVSVAGETEEATTLECKKSGGVALRGSAWAPQQNGTPNNVVDVLYKHANQQNGVTVKNVEENKEKQQMEQVESCRRSILQGKACTLSQLNGMTRHGAHVENKEEKEQNEEQEIKEDKEQNEERGIEEDTVENKEEKQQNEGDIEDSTNVANKEEKQQNEGIRKRGKRDTQTTASINRGIKLQPSACMSELNGAATNGVHMNSNPQQQQQHDQGENDTQTTAATRFQELLEGLEVPGDSGNPPVEPPWLDRALFNKGRQFYQRYLFCVFLADLVALLMMFTVDRILRPLMYTGRSDTPYKALRRYVSTISHVITWYSGDIWDHDDPAHKDILQVRQIHLSAAKTFNSPQHQGKVKAATVNKLDLDLDSGDGLQKPTCPFNASLRQDLQGCVNTGTELESRPALYISQWDQMFTQYAFLGIMVAHPWRMGAWWVTDDEMTGFIHFWRGAGWLLGIEDKYNFCNGNLEETRALCHEMERRVIKPCLSKAGSDHEIMGTALIDGLSFVLPCFSYPAVLRIAGDVLDLPMPSVTAKMSLRHKFHYVFLRVVMQGLFLVPGVIWVFNEMLKFGLSVVQGRHPRWKPKVKAIPYSY